MPNALKSKMLEAKCPIRYSLEIIGGKWKLAILCLLLPTGKRRYSELKAKLGKITNMMLALSLKELEHDGIIRRKQYNTMPPKVEYSITDEGKSLYATFDSMAHWGIAHMEKHGKAAPLCAECWDGKAGDHEHADTTTV